MAQPLEVWICDSPPSKRFTLWTRANVGEVFPDPVLPWSRSTTLHKGAEAGWRDAWYRMGAFGESEFNPDEMEVIGVFGGYCYLNASIIRLFGERAPGLSAQMMDEQFFGTQPGIPAYVEHPGDVRPDLSEKIGEWITEVMLATERPDLLDDQRMTKELRANRPDLTTIATQDLPRRFIELNDASFRWLFSQHLHATYAATVPVGALQQICTAIGRLDLLGALMSGVGDVDSAAPSTAIWHIGRLVASSQALTAAFDAGVDGLLDRLRATQDQAAADFLSRFDAFLFEFGSRGPNEWETAMPTWETKPSLALAAIDRMRLAPDSADPAGHQVQLAAGRENAANEVRKLIAGNAELEQTFELALRSSQLWLASRERTKTNVIRFVQELRVLMREFGRRMVELGHFDEIEDFSMLFDYELDRFLADPPSFRDTIRHRKALWHQYREIEPAFVFDGDGPTPAEFVRRDATTHEALGVDDVIQGIPGCLGVAEGIARVVLDSNDPFALSPGDVLIAPITDPSWTPLFVPAAAVVVDVGAPLSHAIIVSRELGIPCVVSATGATKRIPDGARVRVDGNSGLVTVLELP